MAEYSLRIDEKTGVTIVEIVGDIDIEEQLNFMRSSSYGERTLRLVTDMRRANFDNLPKGELAKMVRAIKPISKSGVKGAWVLEKGIDFSKLKTSLAQIEVLGFDGNYKLFNDLEEAIAWVQK